MSENDAQERTEEPTEKRKKDSRKKGQVPRSKELNACVLLITASISIFLFGPKFVEVFSIIASENLAIPREHLFESHILWKQFMAALQLAFIPFVQFALTIFVLLVFTPAMLGGWGFSWETISPKLERLDPIKGVKRMVSVKGLMELLKAILKVMVIASIGFLMISLQGDKIMSLSQSNVLQSMASGVSILAWSFMALTMGMVIIAIVDIPFQIWSHNQKVKMTKQEVKDELKDTEGKPEVKSKVRQTQQEVARRRMMSALPDADVIITNPEHYAVALKYDENKDDAPTVLAKGLDYLAQEIKRTGKEFKIPLVEAPPLARALYYCTKLNEEIPQGLFIAIAQVLAYVYQLKAYDNGEGEQPVLGELPIPEELQRDN